MNLEAVAEFKPVIDRKSSYFLSEFFQPTGT
jgi:hypothetical protein